MLRDPTNKLMEATRILVDKVGNRLVFGTDFSKVDHQYGDTRRVCFHKGKIELNEGNVVYVRYEGEKKIAGLPIMLVGIREIKVISPDPDLLLDL